MAVLDQVFLVYTPFQTIQAATIAAGVGGRSHLLCVPRQPIQTPMLEVMAGHPDNPFLTTALVRPLWSSRFPLPEAVARRVGAAANVRRIGRVVSELPGPVSVYTANAQTVEGQALVAAGKGRSDGSQAFVIEDGLRTYEKRLRRRPPGREGWSPAGAIRSLYLGGFARRPAEEVRLELIDGIHLTYPDALVDDAWPGVPRLATPASSVVRPLVESMAEKLVDPDDRAACGELDVLVVAPHSRMLAEGGVGSGLEALLRRLTDTGRVVGLKYHPNEVRRYLSGVDHPGIRVLSSGVPVELLFVLVGDRLEWVVTDRTTAVVTAPRFAPGATTVTMVAPSASEQRETHDRLARATGGLVVASADELLAAVDPA